MARDLGIAKADVKSIEAIALGTYWLHVLKPATVKVVSSTTKFQQAQRALEHQIIARQVQLTLLGTEVANASNLTPTDRSTLVTTITNEQGDLATDATNAADDDRLRRAQHRSPSNDQ